jgi:hypothetical protein
VDRAVRAGTDAPKRIANPINKSVDLHLSPPLCPRLSDPGVDVAEAGVDPAERTRSAKGAAPGDKRPPVSPNDGPTPTSDLDLRFRRVGQKDGHYPA